MNGFGSGQNAEMEKVCRNCKEPWGEGDRYCRYCGAPLDQPGYKIREFCCIYGPMPVPREHKCPGCHYSWRTTLMIDHEDYCPRCGTAVTKTEIEEDFWAPRR